MRKGILLLSIYIVFICFSELLAQENVVPVFNNKVLDATFFKYKEDLKNAQSQNSAAKIAHSHWVLGSFYFEIGVFSEATDQFNKALVQLGDNSKDTLRVVLQNAQGSMQLALKNYEEAEGIFIETIKNANTINYDKGLAVSNSLLGSCYEKKGDYIKALSFENKSLAQFVKLQDSIGIAVANENIGSIYEDLEEYALSYTYFVKAYELVKGGKSLLEANILNNIGDIYRKQGDYKTALNYTSKALHLARALKNNQKVQSAAKDMSKTYAFLKNYEKAFEHLQEADSLSSVIFYGQNTNQLNVLQTVYDTNQKETKIKLLEEENKLAKLNKNFWIVTITMTSILVFVFLLIKAKKRKEQVKIQHYQKELLQAQLEKKAIKEDNLKNEVQLKAFALSKYSLHVSHKNKLLSDLASTLSNLADRKNMDKTAKIKSLANEITNGLKQDEEANKFGFYFNEIHPEFAKNISIVGKGKLSATEIRLAMLLRLNLSTKEIASIQHLTTDSVRVARYRLRKKLFLNSETNLVHFLMQY